MWTQLISHVILNRKLTCIGISAITRPLVSSRLLRITTSPPTTMLITIPSSWMEEWKKDHIIGNFITFPKVCKERWICFLFYAWIILWKETKDRLIWLIRLFSGYYVMITPTYSLSEPNLLKETNLQPNRSTFASYRSPEKNIINFECLAH